MDELEAEYARALSREIPEVDDSDLSALRHDARSLASMLQSDPDPRFRQSQMAQFFSAVRESD